MLLTLETIKSCTVHHVIITEANFYMSTPNLAQISQKCHLNCNYQRKGRSYIDGPKIFVQVSVWSPTINMTSLLQHITSTWKVPYSPLFSILYIDSNYVSL